MNNPFDYTPDKACEEAFRELILRIEVLKSSDNPEEVNFCRELESGKMLGVLIAEDNSGESHTLYAFSGQIGDGGFHHAGFVGPVFDYLQPDGYFKTKESDISGQNAKIAAYEKEVVAVIKDNFERTKERLTAELEEYKESCRLSKSERDAKRKSGVVREEELVAMIRQSQFEKAELHRIKKRHVAELQPLTQALMNTNMHLEGMKEKRRVDSQSLQDWLFSNFSLLNARGESKSVKEIFADTPMRIPPSGAGECCVPKLLQEAYRRGWKPVSVAEYWYGKPKRGELRRHGEHYPACRGKCFPVLGWMLQGLETDPPLNSERRCNTGFIPEIIYENEWFCVVQKPSGMLSVPGKGVSLSLQQWLADRYGDDRMVRMAHRLDQDTSGLIVAAFGERPYKVLQTLFAMRKVKKTYIAELDGDYVSRGIAPTGRIELPLSPDWIDRPRQRVDFDEGKEAVTDYEFIGASEGRSRIMFHPLTGRTHQLRVHAASEMGLDMPIAGDRLYGKNAGKGVPRLLLHAHKLEFIFPIDGKSYSFESPAPF